MYIRIGPLALHLVMNCGITWHLFMLAVVSLCTILHLLVECIHFDQYHLVFDLQAILHNFHGCDHHNMFHGLAFLGSSGFAMSICQNCVCLQNLFDHFIHFFTGPNGHRY
jgi:hypothetical protein